jgi:hypothetical protein
MRAVDTPLVVIATPARANLAVRGMLEASMTNINGTRTEESAKEDKEKILSLRKVFVSGPRYPTSGAGVDAGSLGEVDMLRNRADTVGS